MFTREETVTLAVALGAGATAAFGSGNGALGKVLLVLAVAVFVLSRTRLGRGWLIATPRITFGEPETPYKQLPEDWPQRDAGQLLSIPVRIAGGPDATLHADLKFTDREGESLFSHCFEARWSNSDWPTTDKPLSSNHREMALRSEGLAESVDVLAKYGTRVYVFNNESWFGHNKRYFHINEREEFRVELTIRGTGVEKTSVWEVLPGLLEATTRVR